MGDVCAPPLSSEYAYRTELTGDFDTTNGLVPLHEPGNTDSYLVDGTVKEIGQWFDEYQYCVKQGVEIFPYQSVAVPLPSDIPIANADGYLPAHVQYPGTRQFFNVEQYYLGCKELAFASVEEGYGDDVNALGNAAYTNRVLTPGDPFVLQEDDGGLVYTTNTTPDQVGQVLPTYEFQVGDTDRVSDPTQADFAPVGLFACLVDTALGPVMGVEQDPPAGCEQWPFVGFAGARSYDQYQATYPAGPDTCATDTDCGSPSGPTCENGSVNSMTYDLVPNDNFVCFVGCGEYQMEMNPEATPYLSGDWDISDGDAWCQSLGLQYCIEDGVGDAQGCTSETVSVGCTNVYYVCSRYYGHQSSNNPEGSDEEDAQHTYAAACDYAIAAGDVPPLANCGPGCEFTNLAKRAFQCDGEGGGDHICLYRTDCPGGQAAPECRDGICAVSSYSNVQEVYPREVSAQGHDEAVEMLQQFFTRLFSFWTFDDASNDANEDGFYERDSSVGSTDRRTTDDGFGDDANDGNPTPPQVVALTSVCADNNCVEGVPGAFSVNGDDGRTWLAESSFLANLEFFAYTDPNQYPIRNVIVDWGDGMDTAWADGLPGVTNHTSQVWGRGSTSGSTAADNYYKAHRGLTETQQQI